MKALRAILEQLYEPQGYRVTDVPADVGRFGSFMVPIVNQEPVSLVEPDVEPDAAVRLDFERITLERFTLQLPLAPKVSFELGIGSKTLRVFWRAAERTPEKQSKL